MARTEEEKSKKWAKNQIAIKEFKERRKRGHAIEKLKHIHTLMIEEMIVNPSMTHQMLADRFGYSRVWITLTLSSEVFKNEYKRRREEIMNPIITASIRDKVEAATSLSWDKMLEKLTDEKREIPDATLVKILEIGTKALFGEQLDTSKKPAMNEDHLDKLAERLISLQTKIHQPGTIVNEKTLEVTDAIFTETSSNGQFSGPQSDAGQSDEGAV